MDPASLSQSVASSTALIASTGVPKYTFTLNAADQTTALIAIYGAILSTITAVAGLIKWYIERPRFHIDVSFNMQILDGDFNTENMETYWTVDVRNVSNRDMFFKDLSFDFIDSDKQGILAKDYNGAVNKQIISPGDTRSFYIAYSLIHPQRLKTVYVRDGVNRKFSKSIKYKKFMKTTANSPFDIMQRKIWQGYESLLKRN